MRFNGFQPCGRRFQRRTRETARHGGPGPSCRRSRVHGVLWRIEPLRARPFPPPNGLLGIESAAALWPLAATGFFGEHVTCASRPPYDGNGTGGTCNEEIASLIPPIEKRNRTWVQAENGTCGRRMWVIHTLGVSSTLIHIATRFGTSQDITQRSTAQRNKRKTRRSGPSCKNLRSRIAAQQHRRNGKSIQCPFNVTTYLGHTHLVGLCSSVVLVLRNYARHCGKCKPETGRCSVFIATVAFRSQESQKCSMLCESQRLLVHSRSFAPKKTACRKHISPTRRTNVNSCLIFLSFARHSKHLRIK